MSNTALLERPATRVNHLRAVPPLAPAAPRQHPPSRSPPTSLRPARLAASPSTSDSTRSRPPKPV
ncbi:hypothetical protein [Microbacterium sp. NIBRBAC000506063]|uniref:hypothetical protein n=1 Tax=Microbacterium sp. NIBRBAC000506063 TaxID=2734618 RepID=UPI001CB6BE77|nr:hypothetical protein [Microbacterium sp. NIBRBAC000506063]